MRRFRHRRSEQLSATRGPRPGAPEAPAGFVSELADHVRETRQERRGLTRGTSYAVRLALAAALTLVMLGAFTGFGGIGYAAGGVADKVKVVKGKVWTEKAGSASTIGTADDDDDGGGGGGGGGGDDDDDGGGGGGDDDDDGDDDEYEEEEEECDEGVQQQRRAENRLHSDNMRNINRLPRAIRKQAKEAEQNRHRTEVRRLQQAQGECDDIGGGDDDDDD